MATNSDIKINNEDEVTTNSSETNSDTDYEHMHDEDGVNKKDTSGENGVVNTRADDIESNGESKSKTKVKSKSKSKKKRKIKKKESVDVSDTNENSFQTISEEGSVIGRSRKLRKRPKVSRRHLNIDGAIEKKIERKYVELESLLNRQFVEKKTNLTHQHIGQMEILRQQYNLSCHGLPPTGPYAHTTGPKQRPHSAHVRVPSDSDEAYSTIRTLQHFTKYRPPRSHIRSKSAKLRRETCSDSESYRPKRIDINLDTTSLNSSKSSTRPSRKKSSDRGSQRSKSRSSGSPSPNTSPSRIYVPTDHKLKETENPKIKQWLHKKNLQLRKQNAVDRAEKRDKRQESITRESVKLAAHEAGKSKVQEWMRRKRREAYEQAKAEREQKKKLEQQKQEEKEKRTMEFVEGKSWIRPVSGSRMQNAGEGSAGDPSTSTDTENVSSGPIPHPPNSKMMYKRSPAGRIRLKVKPKEETISPEGTDKSTEESQMSYSEWLKKKRLGDAEKKKAELEAKAKAEPDPDLKVLLPEMSKKRINRVTETKKSVDSGLKSDDGGCSDSQTSPDPDESTSPVLKISGAKATITSRSGHTRPQSALARPPVPQPCKSPKRPRSAHPRVEAIMNADDDEANTENPFKLPFPAKLGLPSEVAKAQSKIFPDRVADERRSLESMRLEPQGCDSSLAETKPIVGNDEGELNEETTVEDGDGHVTESEKEAIVEEPVVGAAFFRDSVEDDTPAETKVPPESESKTEDDVTSGNDNQYFLEKSLDKHEPDKQIELDRIGESCTVDASVEVDQVNVTELPSEQIPMIQDPTEAHDEEEENEQRYYEDEDEEGVGGDEEDVQNEITEKVPNKQEITGETVQYLGETSLKSVIPDTNCIQKDIIDDNDQSFLEQGHPKREPDKHEECRKSLLEQVVDALPELEEEGPNLSGVPEEQTETNDESNEEEAAADEVEQTTIVAPEQQELTETEENLEDQEPENITMIHTEQLSDTVTEDSQNLTFNTEELKQYVLKNYHPDEKQPDTNGKQNEVLESIEEKATTEITSGLNEQEEIMESSESDIEEQISQEAENQEIPSDLHNQLDSHIKSKQGTGLEQDDASLPGDEIVVPDIPIYHVDITAEDTMIVASVVSELSELSETHVSTDQREIQEPGSAIVESPESTLKELTTQSGMEINNIAENATQLKQTDTELEYTIKSYELFDTPEVPPQTEVYLDSQTVDNSEVKTGEIAFGSEFVKKAALDTTEITEMSASFEPEKSNGSEFGDEVTQNASETKELSVPEEHEIPEAISDSCEEEIRSSEHSPVPQLKITETAEPNHHREHPNDYGVYEQFVEDEVTLSTAIAEDPDSSTANSLASLDMDDTTVLKQSYALVKTTAETQKIPEDDSGYNNELDEMKQINETEESASKSVDNVLNISDVIHPASRIHSGPELFKSTTEEILEEDHVEKSSTTSQTNDAIHEDLESQNSNDLAKVDSLRNINNIILATSTLQDQSETSDYVEATHVSNNDDLLEANLSDLVGLDRSATTIQTVDATQQDFEAQNSNDVAEEDSLRSINNIILATSALQMVPQTVDNVEHANASDTDDLSGAKVPHDLDSNAPISDIVFPDVPLEPVIYKEDQTDLNVDYMSEEERDSDQRGELEGDTGDKEDIRDVTVSVDRMEDTIERPESEIITVVNTSITTTAEDSNTLVEIENQRSCNDEDKQELAEDSLGEAMPKHLVEAQSVLEETPPSTEHPPKTADDQTPIENPLDESPEAYGSKDLVETQTILQGGETSPLHTPDCVEDETPTPDEVDAPGDFNDLHDDKMSAQVAMDEESDDDIHQLRMRLHRLRSSDDFVSEIVDMHRNLNELDTSFEVPNTSGTDDAIVATMNGYIENGDSDLESDDLNNNGKSNKLLETLNDLSSAVESKTKPAEVTVEDNNNEMLENLKNEFNLEPENTRDEPNKQNYKLRSILSDTEISTRDENGNVGGSEKPGTPGKRVSFSSRPIVIQGDGSQEPIVTSDDGASSAYYDVMALMS